MRELEPGRWPPAYDAEQLQQSIRDLVDGDKLHEAFYEPLGRPRTGYAQGDILELDARFVYLNRQASPSKASDPNARWIIIGNTCDLDRSIDQVRWTQLVPVRSIGLMSTVPSSVRAAFRRYKHGRRFFVPPWTREVAQECLIAEFTEMLTIDRRGLDRGTVVARMDYPGWILFHSCLVRYLARDDGRHDPT